jgi:hypothetical protein
VKKILYKFVVWYVMKYCKHGLTPIYGTNKAKNIIIAWEWRFYDLKYEQKRGNK